MSDEEEREALELHAASASDGDVFTVASGTPLEQVRDAYILWVLAKHNGNKVRAARELGVDRRTIYRVLDGTSRPVARARAEQLTRETSP